MCGASKTCTPSGVGEPAYASLGSSTCSRAACFRAAYSGQSPARQRPPPRLVAVADGLEPKVAERRHRLLIRLRRVAEVELRLSEQEAAHERRDRREAVRARAARRERGQRGGVVAVAVREQHAPCERARERGLSFVPDGRARARMARASGGAT